MIPRKRLFEVIAVLLFIVFAEWCGYMGMYYQTYWVKGNNGNTNLYNHNYFNIRKRLLDSKDPESFQRLLPAAGLNYIPTPGYAKFGEVQHNYQGFRGAPVDIDNQRTLKVLFLGGSTTYGFGVAFYKDSYPAQCGQLLNIEYSNVTQFHKYYDSIVIINAGLDAGTSQEELSGYLYKWKYFNPDIVVIHSGGNDAQAMSQSKLYQPDYTQLRNINFYIKPLPWHYRFIAKSYFLSFITIRIFYSDLLYQSVVFASEENSRYGRWFYKDVKEQLQTTGYQYYAFYQNMDMLLAAITNDKRKVIILPFVLNMESPIASNDSVYVHYNNLNNLVMDTLGKKYKVPMVPYSYLTIKDKNSWLDDCHLNETGEKDKAALVCISLKERIDALISESEKKQ